LNDIFKCFGIFSRSSNKTFKIGHFLWIIDMIPKSRMMKMTLQGMTKNYISENDIRDSVNTVFVFGDNLEGKGFGGQAAVARQFVPCGKAIGIPTKRAPRDDEDAYFSDKTDEICAVRRSFATIRELIREGRRVVFFPDIGNGRAELQHRSPVIYGIINGFIKAHTERDPS
jgi:hypothetical protein